MRFVLSQRPIFMLDDGSQLSIGYLEWQGLDAELVPFEHTCIDFVLELDDILVRLRSRCEAL